MTSLTCFDDFDGFDDFCSYIIRLLGLKILGGVIYYRKKKNKKNKEIIFTLVFKKEKT